MAGVDGWDCRCLHYTERGLEQLLIYKSYRQPQYIFFLYVFTRTKKQVTFSFDAPPDLRPQPLSGDKVSEDWAVTLTQRAWTGSAPPGNADWEAQVWVGTGP